jgi:hypothetical protein
MTTAQISLAVSLALAACGRAAIDPTPVFPGPQLGESTASPGANPSKPAPITPDDPRVMNVSAGVSPGLANQAQQGAQPVTTLPREDATSSTPVQASGGIAPYSTTAAPNQPGVFSPPPVSSGVTPPTNGTTPPAGTATTPPTGTSVPPVSPSTPPQAPMSPSTPPPAPPPTTAPPVTTPPPPTPPPSSSPTPAPSP